MKAGFYESDITPFFDTRSTCERDYGILKGVKTPFSYTAGVWESEGRCVALVGADMIVLDKGVVEYAREELKKRMPLDGLLVGASHTHANPGSIDWLMMSEKDIRAIAEIKPEVRELIIKELGGVSPDYRLLLRKRLVDAVWNAYRRRQEVRLVIGRAKVDNVAYNRRQKMKNGLMVTHAGKGNPDIVGYAGPVDTEVVALGAVNAAGETIGAVVNFGCHGTVSSEGFYSADWPYYMRETVKRNINPRMGVVFLNGCCGDVTQIDNLSVEEEPRTERRALVLGERVGFGAVEALREPMPECYSTLQFAGEEILLNYRDISEERYRKALEELNAKDGIKTNSWLIGYYARDTVLLKKKREQEPQIRCELNAVQIGNLLLLTSPGEVFAQMSLDVKAASTFPFTMVSELTNDYLGYVPTPDVFGPGGGGYEGKYGWGSRLETGAFEKMRTKLGSMLSTFTPEQPVVKPHPKEGPWIAFRPEEL